MTDKTIGTFNYELVDGTKIDFAAKYVVARASRRVREILKSITGKRYDDPETLAPVDEALTLMIGGWSLDEPFTLDALREKMSQREAAALAFLAPGAIDDLEVAIANKRGGRAWYYDAAGTYVCGFADTAKKPQDDRDAVTATDTTPKEG